MGVVAEAQAVGVYEGSGQDAPAAERATGLPNRSVLAAAVVAFSVSLVTAALGLALMERGLAVVWPAAGLVVGLWLITPPSRQTAVIVGIALGLFCGNLLAGRLLAVNVMFVGANLGEAWLVARLMRRWVGRPTGLHTLPQVGYFVLAVALTVVVGGAIGSAILQLIPGVGGSFTSTWMDWAAVRGIGMLTVAPAVIALGSLHRDVLQRTWNEEKATFLLLGAVVVVTFLMVSAHWANDDLLALLLLLALVYPLVLLLAARSEPVWTHVALLLLTLVVVWPLGQGGGIFRGSVEVAQAFLFVSSLWSLTLAVVMEQQRRARDLAERNERSMRDALAAGRGFTFDYDPRKDRVVRSDPDQILAPFLVETGAEFFERVLPEDRERLQGLISRMSSLHPMYEATYGSRRPDGKVVWLQERAVGEFDANGSLTRLQGLTMDVTAQRDAEEALREADRKKDRFIATLAHELRNPLAPIRTAAELLGAARAGPAEVAWARQVIKRQVAHMAELLDDLLDVARITRGKLEIRKEWLRLDTVIESAVEVARPLIDARQIHLTVDLPAPAPMLEADPLRLSQVVSNLLTNAAKYSDPAGRILLQARVRDSVVDISVRDDGIGIPREALGTIFQMFSQVEGTAGRSQGGLGIGLSLVKGLVELHGGSVVAHSEGPGKGSEFIVTMPCVPPAQDPPTDEDGRSGFATTQGRRVLIVDDNRDAADSLGLLLGLEGHEVRVAYAGRPALEAAHEFRPEVAVLDLGLPDLSGYDVARLLRQDPALTGIRLIALTGWGQDEHRKRALEAGFDHHVTKPVDLELLGKLLAAG